MRVILEKPSTTHPIGMLARKNGKYTRPIIGTIIDFRVEDFMPENVMLDMGVGVNMIGRLPDIAEAGQENKYFASTFNYVSIISQQEAMTLFDTGQYIMLPDSPSSEFWKYTKAPWWEFAVVLDEYNGFIKAPIKVRANEPTPEKTDEMLDEFEENRGKIKVVAPTTLEKWVTAGVTESYKKRLDRIT